MILCCLCLYDAVFPHSNCMYRICVETVIFFCVMSAGYFVNLFNFSIYFDLSLRCMYATADSILMYIVCIH